jgi:polyhydroxyalkanoate synthesis regulator phasin
MYEIANDLERISEITAKYEVPDSWLVKCRTELLRELRRQVSVLYSGGGLVGLYKRRDRPEPRLYDSLNQEMVLEELMQEFENRQGKKTEQLACQLTALICSDSGCVTKQMLSPSPEGVRSNIRYIPRNLANSSR